MKAKFSFLTIVLLFSAIPAFADTYSIEAFEFSMPQIADFVGENPVGDRGDTIAQIGNEQTWYCFDISEIPDSQKIISATFTVRMRDYADNESTQRTLWYDPNDNWAFVWPHDPDYYVVKEAPELVAVIDFNGNGWSWITIDVDISRHNWSDDVADNYVTLMLTGPLNGYYVFGDAGFDGAVLEFQTTSADSGKDDINKILNLGPEEIIQADGLDIQVPGYSVPSFVDFNNDKLNDLIIGEGGGSEDAKVRVYLNVGTESEPAFADFFYIRSEGSDLTCPASGCMGCFPRVVYWDADKRKDLLVGQADGTVKIFLNIGQDDEPVFDDGRTITAGPDKQILNVGSRATPTLIDWNNDDMMDIVTGAMDGRIHIYLNCGCSGGTPPGFELSTPAGDFATVKGLELIVPTYRSSPIIFDLDGDGKKDLLTGNTEGQLLFYKNIGTDDMPDFAGYSLVKSDGIPIDLPGTPRSRPSVCYWTGDGHFGPIDNYPDVLIGSGDGKVRLYRGAPPAKTKQGDLDGNGIVDLADLAVLMTCWPLTDCGTCDDADLTGDGNVDKDDIHRFIDIFLLSLEQQVKK
ncbi:MAG: VCBS repeat-containing protein [Sedimentisphaerales bacterium]|nr:VCBS repeat-containing protein [Sedimentisphaerales bacterium]